MLKKYHKVWALICLTLVCCVTGLRANTFFEVESTYEGDGWFRYKLSLPVDPFWSYAEVGSFGLQTTENTVEQSVAPPKWVGSNASFGYAGPEYQARPVEYVFRVKSTYRHFKRNERAGTITMSLIPQVWFMEGGGGTIWSMNMVGFAMFEGLVPCPANEADGSAPYLKTSRSLIGDVRIHQLLMNSTNVAGLRFNLPYQASYVVEGSRDLSVWNAVATGSGFNGDNTLFSSSLATKGPFYRIQITGISSQLLSAKVPASNPERLVGQTVKAVKIQSASQGFSVTFPTEKSVPYQVEFVDRQGQVLKTIKYLAESEQASLPVPADLGTDSWLVRVRRVLAISQ